MTIYNQWLRFQLIRYYNLHDVITFQKDLSSNDIRFFFKYILNNFLKFNVLIKLSSPTPKNHLSTHNAQRSAQKTNNTHTAISYKNQPLEQKKNYLPYNTYNPVANKRSHQEHRKLKKRQTRADHACYTRRYTCIDRRSSSRASSSADHARLDCRNLARACHCN